MVGTVEGVVAIVVNEILLQGSFEYCILSIAKYVLADCDLNSNAILKDWGVFMFTLCIFHVSEDVTLLPKLKAVSKLCPW